MTASPALPDETFDVIIIDPPTRYKTRTKAGLERSPDRHYTTMSVAEIQALPIPELGAKACIVLLWMTGPHIVAGTHLKWAKKWGFKSVAMAFIWIKVNKNAQKKHRETGGEISSFDFFRGNGHYTRQNAEYVVILRRRYVKRHSKSVPQVIVAPRREHSRKPEQFYEFVHQLVGPDRKILEMFARQKRPGITAWGDQIDHFKEAAE